jgi:hypothetical protein
VKKVFEALVNQTELPWDDMPLIYVTDETQFRKRVQLLNMISQNVASGLTSSPLDCELVKTLHDLICVDGPDPVRLVDIFLEETKMDVNHANYGIDEMSPFLSACKVLNDRSQTIRLLLRKYGANPFKTHDDDLQDHHTFYLSSKMFRGRYGISQFFIFQERKNKLAEMVEIVSFLNTFLPLEAIYPGDEDILFCTWPLIFCNHKKNLTQEQATFLKVYVEPRAKMLSRFPKVLGFSILYKLVFKDCLLRK